MNKISLCFFFLLIVTSASAQQTFFKWYITDKNEYIYNAMELPDNHYVLCGYQSPYSYSTPEAYLLKINSSGEIAKEATYPGYDTATTHIFLFQLPGVTDEFNTFQNKRIYSNGNNIHVQSFITYSTSDLSLIRQRNYVSEVDNEIICGSIAFLDTNSLCVQATTISWLPQFHYTGSMVTKYNYAFDSLASYKSLAFMEDAIGLIHDPQQHTIKSITYKDYKNAYAYNLSYDLKVLDTAYLPPMDGHVAATQYNDSSYLITGAIITGYNNNVVHTDINVKKYSMDDVLLDSIAYRNHPDTLLMPGAYRNTVVNEDKIFVVGIYNYNHSQIFWQDSPTWIQVTRLDTSLNILDHHFYGGDASYIPFSIINTSDGGVLIAGNRYDYTKPELSYHPFVLKINSEGLITAMPEHPEIKAHDAIIYPNPGTDNITIQSGQQIMGAQFMLYDIHGKSVLHENINNTQLRLNTSSLSAGVYPWQIIYKNKVIESGKWVKK